MSVSSDNPDLIEQVKEYIDLQIKMVKLTTVEKLSRIVSMLVLIFLLVLLVVLAFFYISFAALGWLSELIGSREIALLLFAAVFLSIGLLLYIKREKWFVNSFVRLFGKIFFDN